MFRDALLARLAEMGGVPDYSRLVSEVLGIRGAPVDLARRLVHQALLVEDRHETWRRVGERLRITAPSRPGVYVFRDGQARALYVGKAANLRRRLLAHFADRRWLSLKPALAGVVHVEWREVGSEIEALVHEATLIAKLQPIVNVQTEVRRSRTRKMPRAIVRDVVLFLPAVDPEEVLLLAAHIDGRVLQQNTARDASEVERSAERLWQFFHAPPPAMTDEGALAPLVFSWLGGRGGSTTRLDPHEPVSTTDLCARLSALLRQKELFAERLVLFHR